MGILGFLSQANTAKLLEFQQRKAIVVDVRTRAEFDAGNIPGSINVPLNELPNRLEDIRKLNKPVIAVCRSGVRSGSAVQFLQQQNIEAVNGGGWDACLSRMQKGSGR